LGVVIDASVLAKVFLPEPDHAAATKAIFSGKEIFLPEVAELETLSAIAYRSHELAWSEDYARAVLQQAKATLAFSAISYVQNELLLADAFTLCHAARHRLPDCFYIALARRLNLPLLTADKKQGRIAEANGVSLVPFPPTSSTNP
jgi:predicted nucleic acid-binding protein